MVPEETREQAPRSVMCRVASSWAFRYPLTAAFLIGWAYAKVSAEPTVRHRAPVREFRQSNPCPSTGLTDGKCPGFVVDHVVPLCFGGPDTADNLQWQELQLSYRKDVFERAACKLQRECTR